MPELPEVETIVRRLRDGTPESAPVPGNVIQSVEITWDKIVAQPDAATFRKELIGKQIIDVRRRAKFLHFPLNQGHLIAHLRMSGDMRMESRVTPQGTPIAGEAYDRAVINFIAPNRLAFSNLRKFGRLWYVEDLHTVFGALGPEPLSPNFSPEIFYQMLHKHQRQIKPLLMDQRFLAGLGNIYTDESLFKAKIHPLRRSHTLSRAETRALHHAIQVTLHEGIANFGSSLDWIYRGGQFQNHFQVYQQEGQPCPVCGTPIERFTVGQRGTRICPNCQTNAPEN